MDDEKNLTDNDLKILEYENKYNLELPRRHSYTYLSIEDFQDYEYTNSLAYEMVRRNEEFEELTKKIFPKKNNEWNLKILELGLDPRINIFPDESNFILDYNKNERFFYESWLSHIINDIRDGLNKLIEYYFDKNKIFILENEKDKYNLDRYKKISDVALEEILQSPHNYYIPCLRTIKIDTTEMKRMQQICNTIPLRILEKDFLNTLKLSDTKYKYTQLMPKYSKPHLSFPQSTVVNIPINLNLKEEEIIAYVLKAKEEYNKQTLTIKHPLELIGNEYKESEKSKSEKELPQEKEKRKKAVADAFYVYDLFKILEPYFKQKSKELRNTRDDKVGEIKKDFKYIKNAQKEKNENIKNLKNTYNDEINQYNSSQLKNIISDICDISTHKVERYQKYMKEYIYDKKYIELITGKVST